VTSLLGAIAGAFVLNGRFDEAPQWTTLLSPDRPRSSVVSGEPRWRAPPTRPLWRCRRPQISKAREIAIGSDPLAMRRNLAVDSIFM
jgi:hypothetical protein